MIRLSKLMGLATPSALLLLATFAWPPAHALTLTAGAAWPNGKIPVCWQEPRPEHRQERALVRKALKSTWERQGAIQFTGWRKCRKGMAGIWIAFENEYPRTGGRGVTLDGMRSGVILPSLWSLAALSINLKAPVHEFGHVLGFGHEYARRDMPADLVGRCGGTDRYGERYLEDDAALTPFDPDSIMVGCRARATRDFSLGVPVLSPVDIQGLVRLYGSHPKNILDADETGDLFGAELRVADINGDGRLDLAVAAPGENNGKGAVYLYRGTREQGLRPWRVATVADLRLLARISDGAVSVPAKQSGDLPPTRPIGFPNTGGPAARDAVRVSADLNGDGFPETIFGLPHADGGAPGSGAVIILRGLADGWTRPWYWFGQRH